MMSIDRGLSTMTRDQETASGTYGRAWSRLSDEASRIRLPELVLFMGLIAVSFEFRGIPLNEAVLGLIALYGFTKKPEAGLGSRKGLAVGLVLLLVYLAVVSVFGVIQPDTLDWHRRLLRMGIVTTVMWFLVSGRLHLHSALAGIAVMLVVNVPLFFLGFGSHSYGKYLTGLIDDKNQAGLWYAAMGLLGLALFRRWPMKVVWLAFSLMALWFTGSRTSLAGFLFALAWLAVFPKVPKFTRIILAGLTVWGFAFVTDRFAESGAFGDRTGTDALRSKIDDASWEKVLHTGPFGQGLGNAVTRLAENPDETWFFHNSYWSAFVEGGWIWMVAIVGITVLVMTNPFIRRCAATHETMIAQATGVVLLIAAWRLGEVFYTVPWALGMAYALRLQMGEPGSRDEQATSADPERTGHA